MRFLEVPKCQVQYRCAAWRQNGLGAAWGLRGRVLAFLFAAFLDAYASPPLRVFYELRYTGYAIELAIFSPLEVKR
jgi:hypothetical protein